MSTINDGGPAFPTVPGNYINENALGEGMTLRDYFAAKVMAAQCGNTDYLNSSARKYGTLEAVLESFARSAYQAADAMLAAREVGK